MQGLRHLEAKSSSGMATVSSGFLQCQDLLVGLIYPGLVTFPVVIWSLNMCAEKEARFCVLLYI